MRCVSDFKKHGSKHWFWSLPALESVDQDRLHEPFNSCGWSQLIQMSQGFRQGPKPKKHAVLIILFIISFPRNDDTFRYIQGKPQFRHWYWNLLVKLLMLVWQCHKPSPSHHHFYGWDCNHQKWVVYDIAIPTLGVWPWKIMWKNPHRLIPVAQIIDGILEAEQAPGAPGGPVLKLSFQDINWCGW